MKIFIEVSSSLEKFFKGENEIVLNDDKKYTIEKLLEICLVPIDEVGIIIKNGIKSSIEDEVSNGDKIKLFPPIIAG